MKYLLLILTLLTSTVSAMPTPEAISAGDYMEGAVQVLQQTSATGSPEFLIIYYDASACFVAESASGGSKFDCSEDVFNFIPSAVRDEFRQHLMTWILSYEIKKGREQ